MSGLKKQFEAEATAKKATTSNQNYDDEQFKARTSQRSEAQRLANTRVEQLQSRMQQSFLTGNLHANKPKGKK